MKDQTNIVKVFENLDRYLFFTFLLLYPFFYLPIFNINSVSKLLLLISTFILLLVIKIIKIILSGSLGFKSSQYDLVVVLIALTYLITGILLTPSLFDAFFYIGTSSFVILSSILFLFTNQLSEKDKSITKNILIYSSVVIAISTLASFTGITKTNILIFENPINNCIYLFLILPFSVFKVFQSEKILLKVSYGICAFLIFVAGFTSIYLLLPQSKSQILLPSFKNSWVVAIDTVKSNPLFGVGPSNFLQAYNKSRPITANGESDWNIKYLTARNGLFTQLTETGVVGLTLFIILILMVLIKPKLNNPSYISLSLFTVSYFILPTFPSIIPILFALIAINNDSIKKIEGINSKNVLSLIALLPFLALAIGVIYYSYITFSAEYFFSKSINSVNIKDSQAVYENINKAIFLNQRVERYHNFAREINMALIKSLINKKELNEEDKKTLVTLVQLTINEAKASVSVNPRSSVYWEHLGDTYASFIPLTKGAEQFAIQSYLQAIALDPINPELRIKLGGIYFNQKMLDEAIKSFELAVLAKPDLANAHYNLALAYKENKQIEKAKAEINKTLSLVGKESLDYEVALKELQAIDELTKPNNDLKEVDLQDKIELE